MAKCVVLVPVARYLEPRTDSCLMALARRGYEVRRYYGDPAVERVRSLMATQALSDGFDELMWIDADMTFDPADVDRLRSHGLPIVGGLYPGRNYPAPAARFLPDTKTITFGKAGGLLEVEYLATGFLLTRRQAYEDIQEKLALPRCSVKMPGDLVPYFNPMCLKREDKFLYLGCDYSFCERARQAGHKVWADTAPRVFHLGLYPLSWEDMVGDRPRFDSFALQLKADP